MIVHNVFGQFLLRFLIYIFAGCLFMGGINTINAQKNRFEVFEKKYNLRKEGYPSQMVPGGNGEFYMVEFWHRDADHPTTGLYLQRFDVEEGSGTLSSKSNVYDGNPKFKITWSKPLIDPEKLPESHWYDYKGIVGLKNGLLIYGTQTDRIYGGLKTVIQFYGPNGVEKGPLQTASTYFSKVEGYNEQIIVSPNGTKLMWLGSNSSEPPAKRKYFCSVWNTDARMQWGHEVKLPHSMEGYFASQFTLDDAGNVYFLMQNEILKNENGDRVVVPRLVRYDYKTRTLFEKFLDFACRQIYDLNLKTAPGNLAYVTAILKTGIEKNIPILDHDKIITARWNEIGIKQYKLLPDLTLLNATQFEVPDTLCKRYPGGGFFNKHHIMIEGDDSGGSLYWTIEETRTIPKATGIEYIYEDAVIFRITTDSLKLKWTGFLLKDQRQFDGNQKLSFISTIGSRYLHYAYSTGEGIAAKLALSYVDKNTGETFTRDMFYGNENGTNPLINKSTPITSASPRIILMGIGRAKKQEYTLVDIYDLP